MEALLWFLLYHIIGVAFFITIVRLEKAKKFTAFQVEGEIVAAISFQLLWPLFAIVALLLIPYVWSKHYFKKS